MKRRKLLDSHAALVYLRQEKGYEKVKEALITADKTKVPLLMNEINIGEVGYIALRSKLTTDLDEFLSVFLSLPIQPASVDFDLIKEAAKIKGRHPLSYADTFAVATALREEAAIITGDPEFKQVESLVSIEWI
jgi:uncharacterized protein